MTARAERCRHQWRSWTATADCILSSLDTTKLCLCSPAVAGKLVSGANTAVVSEDRPWVWWLLKRSERSGDWTSVSEWGIQNRVNGCQKKPSVSQARSLMKSIGGAVFRVNVVAELMWSGDWTMIPARPIQLCYSLWLSSELDLEIAGTELSRLSSLMSVWNKVDGRRMNTEISADIRLTCL